MNDKEILNVFKKYFYIKQNIQSHFYGGVGKYNSVLEYLGWGKYNDDRTYFNKFLENIPEEIYLNMPNNDGVYVPAKFPLYFENVDFFDISKSIVNNLNLHNIFRRGLYVINSGLEWEGKTNQTDITPELYGILKLSSDVNLKLENIWKINEI